MEDDKNLILKLNNYGYSQQVLDEVLQYKTDGTIPDHVKVKSRFIEKWTQFYVRNNRLIYRPKELLVVIDPEEKQRVMQEMYDNVRTGVGSGIVQFYHLVVGKYLNIRRKDVADFLKRQKTYQLTRNTNHVINKPILADKPNSRWAIDLIELERYEKQNKNYRYILTVIDHFSRFVWARPLKKKTSEDVRDAMEDICQTAGVYPHILQRDNGGEFAGQLTTWLNTHDIKGITTLSNSLQSNRLIENFNNQKKCFVSL